MNSATKTGVLPSITANFLGQSNRSCVVELECSKKDALYDLFNLKISTGDNYNY